MTYFALWIVHVHRKGGRIECISAEEMFNQNDLWKKFRSPGQSNKFIVPFSIVTFGLAQSHVIHTACFESILYAQKYPFV